MSWCLMSYLHRHLTTTCQPSFQQAASRLDVRRSCKQISKVGEETGLFILTPPLLRKSYASATGCATRHRPSRGTLAAFARLIIGSMGSRGHPSGNNWPGFLYTTQLTSQPNTAVTGGRLPATNTCLKEPGRFHCNLGCGHNRKRRCHGDGRGEIGTKVAAVLSPRTVV